MSEYETLRYEELEPGIGLCTINRPEVRNALNEAVINDLRSLLNSLVDDEDLRALIFTGAGEKAFVAGADISELRDRKAMDALRRINTALFRELEMFPRPTIAAIRGAALGGGLEFAMACDLRVCSDDAKLGQPEVALGIIPGAGGTYRLPKLVGIGRAKELIYTGRIIDGAEGLAMGLVNRVVAPEAVADAALDMARSIARNGGLAVRLAKVSLGAAGEQSTDAGMALEVANQAMLFADGDKYERMTRFLERKKR